MEMEAPLKDWNRLLAILILRAAGCDQDTSADIVHCAKGLVGKVEHWFEQLPTVEAVSICYDQAIKNAFWLEIMSSPNEQIEHKELAIAAQMDSDYLLNHYGKVKKPVKQLPLTPDSHQHYARMTDAAEKLRLNIKDIKLSKGDLIGNVTSGHILVSKNEKHPLRNVDRLDAECLLAHLKATSHQFNNLNDWESLTNRDLVVLHAPDSLMKKIKEVSHGLALQGTCKICESWYKPY